MKDSLTRRELLGAAALAALPAWLSACAKREKERVVNFFNWSKYIGPDTLPSFTKETGIAVRYEEFADEEEMFAKLRGGARGYDLIVVSDYMIPRMKELNLIVPLPEGALTGLDNIDKRFRGTPFDPENAFTVPYLWGTTGIGFNKAKLPKAPSSWKELWDEKHSGRMTMLDNARDAVSIALLMLGVDEATASEADLAAAKELLLKQRPLVKQYTSAAYIDGLVAGEIALAMAWSGDCLQAARENPQIDYTVPKEGSYMWMDNLCILRGAPHREDALRLIDHLLKPNISAGIANAVRYATPNAAAREHLDKDLLKDPRVFPTPAMMKSLSFHAPLSPDTTQQWNELWSDVKVG